MNGAYFSFFLAELQLSGQADQSNFRMVKKSASQHHMVMPELRQILLPCAIAELSQTLKWIVCEWSNSNCKYMKCHHCSYSTQALWDVSPSRRNSVSILLANCGCPVPHANGNYHCFFWRVRGLIVPGWGSCSGALHTPTVTITPLTGILVYNLFHFLCKI